MDYFYHFLTLGFLMFVIGFAGKAIGLYGEYKESRDPVDLFTSIVSFAVMVACAVAVWVRVVGYLERV
jgi:cell division protein FtsX